jgi:circadian clock protein KaiC
VVFGPPGSGKTLFGLHFIFKGMEMGEKGLILCMQENPIQVARIAAGLGWDIAAAIDSDQLRIRHASPVEVSIDEVLYNLTRGLDEFSAQRVVIDSLNDLEAAAGDVVRFRDLTYALVQSMVVRGVTLFLTAEIPDLFGTSYLSQFGVSYISDNVILLHYLREESEVKRAITVLKTRGSQHDTAIRQFSIDQTGLHIAGGFSQGTVFAR